MDDFHLDLQQEGDGYRYYVDGQKLHPGDILELQIGSDWIVGRYEWCFKPDVRPYLIIDREKDDTVTLDDHCVVRLPTR